MNEVEVVADAQKYLDDNDPGTRAVGAYRMGGYPRPGIYLAESPDNCWVVELERSKHPLRVGGDFVVVYSEKSGRVAFYGMVGE